MKLPKNMRAIVSIPTYNEKENIQDLINAILEAERDIHVVVVDDDSPDGTAQEVEALSRESARVHLIRKAAPRGRGLADIVGMQYAIKEGFDYILQMDADFSHLPKYIPQFLDEIRRHDVVIGSRLIPGGAIEGRNAYRNIVTQLANGYVRLILGLKPKDCTSGYRCYRKEVLASIDLHKMISSSPSLLEEILYACKKHRFDIYEIPITFIDRKKGKSKLRLTDLIGILLIILKIRFRLAR